MIPPGRGKRKVLVIRKFKVSRKSGVPFYCLEPGKLLHIGGRKY